MIWAVVYLVGAIVSAAVIAKGRGPGAGCAVPIFAAIVWPVTLAVDCLTAAVDVADHNSHKRRTADDFVGRYFAYIHSDFEKFSDWEGGQ